MLAQAFQENPILRAITESPALPSIAPIHARLPIMELPTLLIGSGTSPRSVWIPFQGVERGLSDRPPPGIHAYRPADKPITDELLRFLREEMG